jgi:hypothetical protein
MVPISHHSSDRPVRRIAVPDQPDNPKTSKQKRDERLAAALRANLRRRKEQQSQREREAPSKPAHEGDVTSS